MIDVGIGIKLLEKIAELLKQRAQQRVDFFRNFVEPVWKDFEAVHADYLASFRKYAESVSDTSISFDHEHPVFNAIETDSILSDAMRNKLANAERLAESDKQMAELASAISRYLHATPGEALNKGFAMANAPRMDVKAELRALAGRNSGDAEKRKRAAWLVMSAAENLQRRYRHVSNAYEQLKTTLLAPR